MSRSILAFACLLMLFAGGCVSRGAGDPALTEKDGYRVDAPEEFVDGPYQPIDDGEPLTEAELAAFQSTGELDAKLSGEEKNLVELHFKFFVHKNRRTMERFLLRSELYLPYVKQVFAARGVPEEIAYLAFVESGFNPNAISRAGAGGMWQFMPFTGKKYGLSQNNWLDERRDPFKATEAAATYLLKLHEMFGDWLLAISAYNAGEGKIGRALSGTEATTFFEICRKNHLLDDKAQLKDETQQYVPRFLAVTKIMRNLKQLGFVEPDPRGALNVATLTVPPGVELASLARSANLSWDQFSSLNPAYRRAISPPDATTQAYVPGDREDKAKIWLASKNISLYAGWREHKVRKGDSMGQLASRSGVSTAMLRNVNGKSNNTLKVGEYLLVPGSARAAKATMAKLSPPDSKEVRATAAYKPGPHKGTHTIAAGDTLYALAQRWDTSVDAICDVNDMEPSAKLRLGQVIRIPSGRHAALGAGPVEQTPQAEVASVSRTNTKTQASARASAAPAAGKPMVTAATDTGRGRKSSAAKPAPAKSKFAVVQAGDTLYSLARNNNTSVDALVKLNGLSSKGTLKPGQLVRLP